MTLIAVKSAIKRIEKVEKELEAIKLELFQSSEDDDWLYEKPIAEELRRRLKKYERDKTKGVTYPTLNEVLEKYNVK